MNREQVKIIVDQAKEFNTLINKVHEFDQKFFNTKNGIIVPTNPRKDKQLSIGIYFGECGQTIDVDSELLPDIILLIKNLQAYYQNKIDNTDIEALFNRLKSASTHQASRHQYMELYAQCLKMHGCNGITRGISACTACEVGRELRKVSRSLTIDETEELKGKVKEMIMREGKNSGKETI